MPEAYPSPLSPLSAEPVGTVFDVSGKKDMYGPGAGYHVSGLGTVRLQTRTVYNHTC